MKWSEKCRTGVETFGFDACVDHHVADFSDQLASDCPKGIDVYFESVGGKVFDAVLPLLNTKARVPVCGLIAHYNDRQLPSGPDRLPLLMQTFLIRRIKAQGFIIFDDYPAKQAGALSICVRDPEETKRVIGAIIACLSDVPTANVTEVPHA